MESLDRRRDRIEDRLDEVLGAVEPPELRREVRHVALAGGKRVRPTVTILVHEALTGVETGDGRSRAELPETVVDFAVGVELVHNASLVIDDVIDESELRRGSPSAWAAFGAGPAILASDGLLGEAFALFSTDERAMQAVTEAMVELGEGEATELVARPVDEAEYMELARRKTGALFRAAAELGAIAADADAVTVEAFGEYAERVGVAFQMRDDVLDATADPETLGKPAGRDAAMDRPSLVEVTDLSPEEADSRAHVESERALAALESVDVADSEALVYLRDLAEFVVTRER